MANKASCLSLISDAVLYWNTPKIGNVIQSLQSQGELINTNLASRISLLPHKYIVPNGTYFIRDKKTVSIQL